MAIIDKVFKAAIDNKASDVHIAPGEPFILRRLGTFIKLKSSPLTPEHTKKIIFEILDQEQKKILPENLQIDFSYEVVIAEE